MQARSAFPLFALLFSLGAAVLAGPSQAGENEAATLASLLAQKGERYELQSEIKDQRFGLIVDIHGHDDRLTIQTVVSKVDPSGHDTPITVYTPFVFSRSGMEADLKATPSVEGNRYLLQRENTPDYPGARPQRIYVELHPTLRDQVRVSIHLNADISVGAGGRFTSENYLGRGVALTTPWFSLR